MIIKERIVFDWNYIGKQDELDTFDMLVQERMREERNRNRNNNNNNNDNNGKHACKKRKLNDNNVLLITPVYKRSPNDKSPLNIRSRRDEFERARQLRNKGNKNNKSGKSGRKRKRKGSNGMLFIRSRRHEFVKKHKTSTSKSDNKTKNNSSKKGKKQSMSFEKTMQKLKTMHQRKNDEYIEDKHNLSTLTVPGPINNKSLLNMYV